jgi:hypothetical protein
MHFNLAKWFQLRQPLAAFTLLSILIVSAVGLVQAGQAEIEADEPFVITGQLEDSQGVPVADAVVTARLPDEEEPLAEELSQEEGIFALPLESQPENGLTVVIDRPHFKTEEIPLSPADLAQLTLNDTVRLGTITLQREITLGFWAATIIFIAV